MLSIRNYIHEEMRLNGNHTMELKAKLIVAAVRSNFRYLGVFNILIHVVQYSLLPQLY
jgi:hypothetical protein